MRREAWHQRLVRWFYGIDRSLDEHERQVLDRAGHNMTISLMGYLGLSGLGMSLLMQLTSVRTTVMIWQFTNLIVWILAWVYLSWTGYRLRLSDVEVTAKQYPSAIKSVLKRSQRQTLVTIIIFQFLDALSNAALESTSYWQTFFSWPQLRTLLVFTVAWSGASVLMSMARVKVIQR